MSSEVLSLLSRLSRLVAPEHRGPGDELFCEGAVSDLALQPLLRGEGELPDSASHGEGVGQEELSCRIEDPDPVRVSASWGRMPSSEGRSNEPTVRIELRCSCAGFTDARRAELLDGDDPEEVEPGSGAPRSSLRAPCPHAWAMFLAAEQHGLLDAIAAFPVEVALGPPMETEPLEPSGYPLHDHGRSHDPGPSQSAHSPGKVKGWRSVVDQAHALSRPAESASSPTAARGWSFWAVLDPDSLRHRRGRLHLDLYRQALRRDGSPSAFLPTTLSDLDASAVPDAKQRRALGLLRSLLAEQQRSERVVLDSRHGEDHVAFLLGALARTGCLRLPAVAGDDDGPCTISWQGGHSWTLDLRLDTGGAADARLRGFFCREVTSDHGVSRQERPVHEALLVLRQGLLLWPATRRRAARLAAVELTPAEWAWIQTLRKHNAEVRVPRDEIDSFLEVFWSRPDAPELTLPKRYQPKSRTPVPTPILALRLLSEGPSAGGSVAPTGALEVALRFDYSGREIDPTATLRAFVDSRRRVRIQRDLDHEIESAQQLDDLPELPHRLGRTLFERGIVVLPVDVAGLPRLLAGLALALEEKAPGRDWRVDFCGRPVEVARRLDARIDTRIDWFDLEATAHFDSGSCQLPELLDGLHRRGGFVDLSPAHLPAADPTDSERTAHRAPLGVLPPVGIARCARSYPPGRPRPEARPCAFRFRSSCWSTRCSATSSRPASSGTTGPPRSHDG